MAKVNTAGLTYDDFKKVALNADLMAQRVQLSDIEIDTNGQLSIGGVRLASDETIQKQLYKILNLSSNFINKFGKMTDETTKQNLIQMLKSGLALSDVKKQNITVLGNPTTKLITHLLPGNHDYIPNATALQILERIMNTYKAFNISSFGLESNGDFNVSLSTDVVVKPIAMTGEHIWHEEFNPGINLRKRLLQGIDTNFFTRRKICENGAIIVVDGYDVPQISTLTDESLEKYFNDLNNYRDNGFVPPLYGENIERAMRTNVSFAELVRARDIILHNSSIKDDVELTNFLPEFATEVHKLAARGVDYVNCTDRQLQNYPVNHKMWDVVNRLTDFGSHDYGFSAENDRIQRQAGELFGKKTYDSENVIVFKN